jgi:hypothetical protein
MGKHYLLIVALFCLYDLAPAQTEQPLNKGLSEPQPAITLPKSRSVIDQPVRKEKEKLSTQLLKLEGNEWIISGGWEMIAAQEVAGINGEKISSNIETGSWYNTAVPGTVLTTLVEQGVYPDPLYGLNNFTFPDSLCRMNWIMWS